MKLRGQVAVVTGASRGIGKAIARALQREGAKVAGCSRSMGTDVRVGFDVKRFADGVLDRLGAPDILVNNAGTVARVPLADMPEEIWDAIVDANLKGTYLVTRAFLPAMIAKKRGRIINVASISGRQGTARLTAYCAAKHGIIGLTRALAEELRPSKIVVNAICPGSVDTDMLRIGMPGAKPVMTADEVARVALFLAADAPAALTGSCVDVFG